MGGFEQKHAWPWRVYGLQEEAESCRYPLTWLSTCNSSRTPNLIRATWRYSVHRDRDAPPRTVELRNVYSSGACILHSSSTFRLVLRTCGATNSLAELQGTRYSRASCRPKRRAHCANTWGLCYTKHQLQEKQEMATQEKRKGLASGPLPSVCAVGTPMLRQILSPGRHLAIRGMPFSQNGQCITG